MKILVIEDNTILRDNIKKYLEFQKYSVEEHSSYTGAVHKIMVGGYDVIILDLWLGEWEWDGLDICSEARNKGNTTPILMLTARTLVAQKVEWLKSGADDYMTKPFDYTELVARLQALTRREKSHKGEIISYRDIVVDKQKREVTHSGTVVQLSKLEFRLLVFLLENTGRALKKEEIIEQVWWDIDLFENTRKLDIYIGYLRKKVDSEMIETLHGVWYIIP